MTYYRSRRLAALEARCAPDPRDAPRYMRPGPTEAAWLETLSIPELRALHEVAGAIEDGHNPDTIPGYDDMCDAWSRFADRYDAS